MDFTLYGLKFIFKLKKTIKNNAYILDKQAFFDGELAEMCFMQKSLFFRHFYVGITYFSHIIFMSYPYGRLQKIREYCL